MTLDEAIAHAREVAKEHKEKAEYQRNRGIKSSQIDLHIQTETEQAKEHEQLAEWLEELKAYRTLDKTKFSDGYNRGVDGFVSRLETVSFTKTQWDLIKTIAEQLKAGGKND